MVAHLLPCLTWMETVTGWCDNATQHFIALFEMGYYLLLPWRSRGFEISWTKLTLEGQG